MMSMNFSNFAILNINGVDYHCIIKVISNNGAVYLLHKANLNEKSAS